MNKIDFINTIEKNVRDEAGKFIKSCTVSNVYYNSGTDQTEFTVDSVSRLFAGDMIIIQDGLNDTIKNIFSIDITNKKLMISGDHSSFVSGTNIKKTDSFTYLDQALLSYSKFRPKKKVKTILNPNDTSFEVPDNWQQEFSWISEIEYPLNETPKNFIDQKLYSVELQEDDTYRVEYCESFIDDLKLYYNISHSFDVNNESISVDTDFNCICDIASSYYLLALASRYAQSVDSTINADAVNNQDKVNQFIRLSNEYLNKASMWLNIDVTELKKGKPETEALSFNQEINKVDYLNSKIINY